MTSRAPSTPPPLLAAEGLSLTYPGRSDPALKDVSLTLAAGETLGLVGPSGCGKTTLGRVLLRLVRPDTGRVALLGEDWLALSGNALRRRRGQMQLVFQDPLAAFSPRATAGSAIADALRLQTTLPVGERPARIARLLARTGLSPDLATRPIHALSGGQRQRVAIARAIATEPRLIVLDEAVSALDISIRGRILRLLVDLQQETGVSYLFISHDIAVVRAISHRLAVMDQGQIVETGETEEVLATPGSATLRALIAAVTRLHACG
ncbi:ABC transporter ATP-binding protein [Haematobacter missouriensis]|uniref:ABC transporter ATP-binding protein n=1 Tax=Haematobacter missouriensis TaxID=366616 RepID=A0A212AJ20_9RHOB|nr:ATP-binding cassette domain-containing protein [Haematobacter missouriensis]KFI32982.1 ABC transporter ATP-binding protein [Haematobacter missouriensis]OWJ74123.1 ABC transporter ATP-binding protein [Haematobacter missouriensis]OWJ81490.1 ABC transporter ATP-binding protein [Haematobacter missouriensis]